MTMCVSNHALFIHGNRKCSASCSMERRQVFPKSFTHARTRAKKLLSSLVAYSLGHTLVKGAVTLTAAQNFEGEIQLYQESARFEKIPDAELVGHVNLFAPTDRKLLHTVHFTLLATKKFEKWAAKLKYR